MKRSQIEKQLKEIAADIKKSEDAVGIIGLNTEYPNARELEEIRNTYFKLSDIEAIKKLITLRVALSKAFIANAQLNLSEARKELNKAKFKGPKSRLYAAVASVFLCNPVYESYGVSGTLTALFVLYMVASYYDHSSKVEQEEELAEARSYFDACRDRLMETKKETKFFIDSERYNGEPSEFYKIFEWGDS